jgi:hypothetical protein
MYRLPDYTDPSKKYIGKVMLANGCYEIHRDLKGSASLIIPKPLSKDRLNVIPFNREAAFSLKLSYRASELSPENKHGEYVAALMAAAPVSFREITMQGNIQYGVFAGDTWVATVFDDSANAWVLKKEIVRTLLGNGYAFVGIPRTGRKTDGNSFVTSTGKYRSAQIITFKKRECGAANNAAALNYPADNPQFKNNSFYESRYYIG